MDYSPKHVILLKIIIRKAKLDYIELTLIMISHFVIKKTVSITLILRMGGGGSGGAGFLKLDHLVTKTVYF